MENLCSSFFSFTSLAGVGGGVIMVTLSCPCPSPRHANIFCGSPLSVSLTLRDSLISWVTNYGSNLGFLTCLSRIVSIENFSLSNV